MLDPLQSYRNAKRQIEMDRWDIERQILNAYREHLKETQGRVFTDAEFLKLAKSEGAKVPRGAKLNG